MGLFCLCFVFGLWCLIVLDTKASIVFYYVFYFVRVGVCLWCIVT